MGFSEGPIRSDCRIDRSRTGTKLRPWIAEKEVTGIGIKKLWSRTSLISNDYFAFRTKQPTYQKDIEHRI